LIDGVVMKIFWAWQSDHPGKISRHFVRDCLEAAIERLRQPRDIDEPTEAARRGAVHLDHDRKGLRGFKDISTEILKKIEKSSVFIGDITPVGSVPAGEGEEQKKLINSNVAIELGYALGKITEDNVLAVLNTVYGSYDDLPFDIQGKDGVLLYRLGPEASKEEIKKEAASFTGALVTALRPFVEQLPASSAGAPVTFKETRPTAYSQAFFTSPNERLAPIMDIGGATDRAYSTGYGPAFYLRVIPTVALARPLAGDVLDQKAVRLTALTLNGGGYRAKNDHGAVNTYPRVGDSLQLESFTQVFRNGELWGVNTDILHQGSLRKPFIIPWKAIEATLYVNLRNYVDFTEQHLGVLPPYTVEVGITGVKNRTLTSPDPRNHVLQVGEMYENDVVLRRIVRDTQQPTLNAFLLEFFEAVYRQTGHERPQNLYGFPSMDRPYFGA
jgi:hypothetical protein